MKINFKKYLFFLIVFFLSIHLIGQGKFLKLGYEGATEAYLKKDTYRTLYDTAQQKIIFQTNERVVFEKIPRSNTVIKYYRPTSKKTKVYGLINLENGYASEMKYMEINHRNGNTYLWGFTYGAYWQLNDKAPYLTKLKEGPPFQVYTIRGWSIGRVKENDKIEIDLENKKIEFPKRSGWVNMYGYQDLLLYVGSQHVFIDTLGRIIKNIPEGVTNSPFCYKRLKRSAFGLWRFNKKYEGLKKEAKFNEKVSFFKTAEGVFMQNKKGKISQTEYTNFRRSSTGQFFVKQREAWFLLNKNLKLGDKITNNPYIQFINSRYLISHLSGKANIFDLEAKVFLLAQPVDAIEWKVIGKRYLLTYQSGKQNIFDVETQSFLINGGADRVYFGKRRDHFFYLTNKTWTKKILYTHQDISINLDTIINSNLSFTYGKKGENYIIINNKTNQLVVQKEKNLIQLTAKYGFKCGVGDPFYATHSYYNFNNISLPFSNIQEVKKITGNIISIRHSKVGLYDIQKKEILNLERYGRYNKESIFTLDEHYEGKCYDFKGVEVKCELDHFERIDVFSRNKDANKVEIYKELESIVEKYPEEYWAKILLFLHRFTSARFDSLDLKTLKKDLNNVQTINNIFYCDIDFLMKIVDGVLMPEKRKDIIKSVALYSPAEDCTFLLRIGVPGLRDKIDFKSYFYYMIGYLYHLEGDKKKAIEYKEIAIEYKEIAIETSNDSLKDTIFNLY